MISAVSVFEKPRMRRNSLRSSSVRTTIFSRAALMPLTKGIGEELAKRVNAGTASCAIREAAYVEWRMVMDAINQQSSDTALPKQSRIVRDCRDGRFAPRPAVCINLAGDGSCLGFDRSAGEKQ